VAAKAAITLRRRAEERRWRRGQCPDKSRNSKRRRGVRRRVQYGYPARSF
jgi:hypothetical protein